MDFSSATKEAFTRLFKSLQVLSVAIFFSIATTSGEYIV
jgi:hypothetical protein